MVLKRCVYGVDKNPMAVELAKVALWLHTFTVGAPLSFLDHHLRCGDSLFGAWARGGIDKAAAYGSPLLLHESVTRASRASKGMEVIETLTDSEIAEAQLSAETFAEVEDMTAPLDAVLRLVHALDWLDIRDRDDRAALQAFFGGRLGDPIEIALGRAEVSTERPEGRVCAALLAQVRRLAAEERFLNWQAAFPGVWTDWHSAELRGGFDAAIGNPPWDRMKLQQVEWFATRRPDIAQAPRAADRKRKIASLEKARDPLAAEYARASERAAAAARMALTTAIYDRLPVLVDRSSGAEAKAWPVKYSTMFHMTNDSGLFRTREALEEQEGAWPIGGNRYDSPKGQWVPLYEGKMAQAFDHRAASVVVNLKNRHRPAQPLPATLEQHRDPDWLPDPLYWVRERDTTFPAAPYLLTSKDVTAPTNVRSMIAALIPGVGAGNVN